MRAQQLPSGDSSTRVSGNDLQQLVTGKVTVQVVHSLEVIKIDHEQDAGRPRDKRKLECVHQFAAIGEAGRGVGIGVAFGGPLCLVIGFERILQILRTTPAEQDDGNIQDERDRQSIVVSLLLQARERRGHDLAAERDKQNDCRRRCTARDQLAARDPHSRAPRTWHFPVTLGWSTAD